MNKLSLIIIQRFVNSKIDVLEFEQWLYSSNGGGITEDIYQELIQIDYNDKSARQNVEKLLEEKRLIGDLHKEYLICLIDDFLSKSTSPISGIGELADWAFKGYTFLGGIEAIGNFNEQGKSIIYLYDKEDTTAQAWEKINKNYPDLIEELNAVQHDLKEGKIKLTGESKSIKSYGKFYEYVKT